MEQKASDIIGFAPSALWVTLGVLVAAGIIAKLVMDLIIKARELKKPKVADEKTVQDRLNTDNERLSKLEDITQRQDEELRLILQSQMDIIHHMVDGNGVDQLRKTQRKIEKYLIYGEEGE